MTIASDISVWKSLDPKVIKDTDDLDVSTRDLAWCIEHAKFDLGINSVCAKEIFANFGELAGDEYDLDDIVENMLRSYMSKSSCGKEDYQRMMNTAIAYLNAFVQINFTGPEMKDEIFSNCLPGQLLASLENNKNKHALAYLSRDGEDAYHLLSKPYLLVMAISMFKFLNSLDKVEYTKVNRWWFARSLFVNQRIIDGNSGSLQTEILSLMDQVISDLPPLEDSWRQLYARYYVEVGLYYSFYGMEKKSMTYLENAKEIHQFDFVITGALGKRTKFQTFETAQLIMKAKSSEEYSDCQNNQRPRDVLHNDDTLLEKIKLSNEEENDKESLKPLDQAILLAFCQSIRNSSPKDSLTFEQMSPYVNRVLNNPNNWMIYTMALLFRSRLESDRPKTVERAALQVQALVDQFPLTESTVSERTSYFFQLLVPSIWELKKELADRFISIGVIKSAMEIYESLELWEDVVHCLVLIDRKKQAETLIMQELEKNSSNAKLWCILGDILNDITHYEKAWEVSGHRFARAQRSLGRFYFLKNNFDKAIESYEKALAINPLFENSWFILGCASMQVQDWPKAIKAFLRVVRLDHENGEAWNNLASIYSRTGKIDDAYRSLKEALKSKYDCWKIWENYMAISLETYRYQDVILAYNRLLDLKGKDINIESLGALVHEVFGSAKDRLPSHFDYSKQIGELLGRVSSKISTDPKLWKLYAWYHEQHGNVDKMVDCLTKAYRSSQKSGFEYDPELFQGIAKGALNLGEALKKVGSKERLFQGKLILRNLIKKSQEVFGNDPLHSKLSVMLDEIVEMERALSA